MHLLVTVCSLKMHGELRLKLVFLSMNMAVLPELLMRLCILDKVCSYGRTCCVCTEIGFRFNSDDNCDSFLKFQKALC